MERVIKFRAWHNDTKCMYADTGLTSLGLNDAIEKALKSEYILMQFTGLHDKNGKEIYEGDLLQWSDEKGLASTVYFEVFYDDGNAVNSNGFKCYRTHYKGNRCGGYVPPFHHDSISKMIVIGNLYENPELLNQ